MIDCLLIANSCPVLLDKHRIDGPLNTIIKISHLYNFSIAESNAVILAFTYKQWFISQF